MFEGSLDVKLPTIWKNGKRGYTYPKNLGEDLISSKIAP